MFRRPATAASPSLRNSARPAALLAGVSLLALVLTGVPAAHTRPLAGTAAPTPSAAAVNAAQAASQQAARTTTDALKRATQAIQAMQATQSAARAAAAAAAAAKSATATVPNGLGVGGLLPNVPAGWTGAGAPVETLVGDRTKVTVGQTQSKAILNWQTFNVGAKTDLVFDQQGNRNWVALNRVSDSTAPSQILGSIKADGSVYVINGNGIIFGGTSQVNVGTLVASTAAMSDAQFTTNGLYSAQSGGSYAPSFNNASGSISVQAGAEIATAAPASVTSGGGLVLLMGKEVTNAGTIATPKGQVALAAGDDFVLRAGYSTTANTTSTTRGIEIAPLLHAGGTSGTVSNSGFAYAQEGDITLVGHRVVQDGLLMSTTSVNTRGTIHLLNSASDTTGGITLTGASVTEVLPDLSSTATALDSQRAALAATNAPAGATGQFDLLSPLVSRGDQSLIEIVSGGIVDLQTGSLTLAQGGQVNVSAAGRIFAADGATIDVSGTTGTMLAMASNAIKINVQGNELRDAPSSRDGGALINSNVWVDIRDLVLVAAGTGGYTTDRYYTRDGLLEVSGHLANLGHTIGEWTAVGGTIRLSAPEVVTQKGAILDISGGAVSYAAGTITTTGVLGSNGSTYHIGSVPSDVTVVGLAGAMARNHARWGVTETWSSPLTRGVTSTHTEAGYTVGRDAGSLIVSAPTAVLEGTLVAGVITGEGQTNTRPAGVTDGYKLSQNTAPSAGTLSIGLYTNFGRTGGYDSDVRIGDIADITRGMSATTALTRAAGTVWLDAGRLSAEGLGGLSIVTTDTVAVTAPLTMAAGGQIDFTAPVVTLGANVTARSGSLTVTNVFTPANDASATTAFLKNGSAGITVGAGVTLDLRGAWVNLRDQPADGSKLAHLDGGDVVLKSTHDVTLATGSRVDVSSGAAILTAGKTEGGRGGNIALIADQEIPNVSANGLLTLNGTVAGYGVTGGGTLTLNSGTAIAIGGKVTETNGVLKAGERSPVELVLAESYTVQAGDVLPVDYSYTVSVARPGEAVGPGGIKGYVYTTLAADWRPPALGVGYRVNTKDPIVIENRTFYGYSVQEDGTVYVGYIEDNQSKYIYLSSIPAGTTISLQAGSEKAFAGYVVPADVFPNGIAIEPYVKTVLAGSTAPADVTLASGTILAAGAVLNRSVAVLDNSTLDTSVFQSGFSTYAVTARTGVAVTSGAALEVTVPVYRLGEAAYTAASGADPAAALDLWTPPTYLDAPSGTLTQRAGASISLTSTRTSGGLTVAGGPIVVAADAAITVDPGQSIRLSGGDVIVDGRLTAPGGTITLNVPRSTSASDIGSTDVGVIWVGDRAVLDVAGRAVTATDARGRRYGSVTDGGTIAIGGTLDWETTGETAAADAFVVIRAGALLDASGASGTIDVATPDYSSGKPVTVASDGGTIVLASNNALYVDGTLKAAAGGAGAAGGTLALALATPNYWTSTTTGDVLHHRELVLAQTQGGSLLPDGVTATTARGALTTGSARFGVDRIAAGGFGNLSLLADGLLSFDGNVALSMSQSLRLYAGSYALGDAAASNATVSLAAPYLRLAGVTRVTRDGYIRPTVTRAIGASQQTSAAVFRADADLIDIRDDVGFGARGTDSFNTATIDRRGFALVDLNSRGDLRLLAGDSRQDFGGGATTRLASTGSIRLTAAQVYPATNASARIIAGYRSADEAYVHGTALTIRRAVDGDVATPFSAFGRLTLLGETIDQGGIVRAPLGSLTLGSTESSKTTDTVTLRAGSVTSVSGAGLVLPYGGTIDGTAYTYADAAITLQGVFGFKAVTLAGGHVAVESGSQLDLTGGGSLVGAGFISGRGGSVDILQTPLASAGPGYSGFSRTGNAVYAIVPTSSAIYAPVAPDAGWGDPVIGRTITVPAGVPGLAAGTYTLMPSTYALLPGAFRVEIGAGDQTAPTRTAALGNGSYMVAGTLGFANTTIRDALPSQVIITSAAAVRSHATYNETSYAAFVLADAQRLGVPRAGLEADAGTLQIQLANALEDGRKALSFAGALALGADTTAGGYAGSVALTGVGEVLAVGQSATSGLAGASVWVDALDALAAPRLLLNASLGISYGQSGRTVTVNGTGDIVVRSGAVIRAGDVIIGAGPRWSSDLGAFVNGSITIEEGAAIIAKGGGPRTFDSSDGYVFTSRGTLAVSSGWMNLMLSNDESQTAGIDISVGSCVATCALPTRLIADGTIAVATSGAFTVADNTSYGAKNLVLGVASVDLGESAAIAAAAASGQLPAGLVFDQAKLAQLLAGNTATGAPAVQTLVLNARDAVHVFGSVDLDASSLNTLVLGTPAIYGYGTATDVATLRANNFVWTGSDGTAGAPVQALLGGGKLVVEAGTIRFGYGADTQPASKAVDDRLALGFSGVTLAATQSITANATSTLAVYQSRGGYTAGSGWAYDRGDLTMWAPVITGSAGAKLTVKAGGDVALVGPAGSATTTAAIPALGATLAVAGQNILVDTAVALPSGSLTLAAQGEVTLAAGARLDLAGRAVTINDVTKYSAGGDLVLTSTTGDITQAAGALIDVSATNNRGGTVTVTAMGTSGRVDLAGTIRGGATGTHDAGGTVVPYDGAELTIAARSLADFAGLNARLTTGEVFGARRFRIKEGDLVVGDGVKARDVEITLDGGSLTVNGGIDASGAQVGTIRLAATGDLVVNGLLDTHGTKLRVDSYGQVIESANRGIVHLTTTGGQLTLGSGAAIDLRAGTAGTAVALGTLDLDAPRLGANDVAVTVAGAPTIRGAKTIAVNAFRTYDDAPLAGAPDVSGHTPQLVTQAYLDAIDGDSRAFIDAASQNTALASRLAGLGTYRLRPGVEIVSNAARNPSGDLTVVGDLDLSNHRYGTGSDPNNPALRGYGEPGVLSIRAAGTLTIHGSITDGFAPPAATPDDQGWLLTEGTTPYGGDIVVPINGVVLDVGTQFAAGATLNYDVPVAATTLPTGTVLPVDAVLTRPYAIAAGTILAAPVYAADGSVAYAAGTVIGAAVTLPAGMRLGAGTPLAAATGVAAMVWPKGVALPVAMTTTGAVTLASGAVIPSMTNVQLANDASVDLRGGVASRNWAVAPMLAAGTTSWSLGLAAGADTASADRRAVAAQALGSIVLADTHYRINTTPGGTLIALNAAGANALYGYLGYLPDGMNSPSELVGKSEAEIVALYGALTWDDFGLPGFWDTSAGNILTGLTAQGVDIILEVAGGLPPGVNSKAEMLGKTEPELIALYMVSSWDDFGLPGFWDAGNGNSAVVSEPTTRAIAGTAFSVLRTGTGDLALAASGDIAMRSLYGVYTAGTASSVAPTYDRPRGALSDGSVLGTVTGYDDALAAYRAWYPEHGGNLTIAAGRDLIGDIHAYSGANGDVSSGVVGNWLWRQGSGSTALDSAIPTAWWINFGTYARVDTGLTVGDPQLVGFTGFGTLGGGNVDIRVGGDAGKLALRGTDSGATNDTGRSQGLVVAIGSTGRVGPGGALTLTGGGDLDLRVAGALNPFSESSDSYGKTALAGSVIDLRGAAQVAAGSIGEVRTYYRQSNVADPVDPRGIDPFAATGANAFSGLTLVPGDAAFAIATRGDMVIAGAGDATRSVLLDPSAFTAGGISYGGGGHSWFTLWTDHTAIDLVSAGGNIAPSKAAASIGGLLETDVTGSWPATLRVAALGGSVYYGASAGETTVDTTTDLIAPSLSGELSILAAGSIYAGKRISYDPYVSRHTLLFSSTGTALPTPFAPAFASLQTENFATVVSNLSIEGDALVVQLLGASNRAYSWNQTYSLFAFGPNTAATASLGAAAPIRIYAGGDIVGLGVGAMSSYRDAADTAVTAYLGGAPLRMIAGRDIVASGTMAKPDLIVHDDPTDVSVIQAGRDILHSNIVVAGPGTLEVTAGRDIRMEDKGSVTSIGAIVAGDIRSGASLALLAGAGSDGPTYVALRARYLDPANRLPDGTPLAGSGKAPKTYEAELIAWLKERYGVTAASPTEALAYFDALAPEQQRVFLRSVYYAELRAGGREYNDPTSSRYGSYLRGREVIATLFPTAGNAGRNGDIQMYGGSSVRTNFGGNIEMLAPNGRIVIGVEGTTPPATAGVVTQGSGDIALYARGSVLLGLSRIMTTFGGDILAWSAEGDINAGRGAKTTVIYTPPKRVYDMFGNVTLAPAVPSSGAGIATLNPVAGVAPGDIDLIAPLGTIDAGEAGIRVSGNINVAALQVVNATNIQVQGKSSGVPQVQAPNVAGLTAASNIAGAAAQGAAAPAPAKVVEQPSIIIVEVIGFGDEPTPEGDGRQTQGSLTKQDPANRVQVLDVGELSTPQRQRLLAEKRSSVERR